MVSLKALIVSSPGKVVALPEEYDLMSHVSGVYSDDGASTFIENMLKEEPKSPKKRSHSISSIPEELLIMAPQEESKKVTDTLNDLSTAVKSKHKSSRSSKNEKSKRKKKKKKLSSSEQASAPNRPRRNSHENISVVRNKEAPSTPKSGFNTVLTPTSRSQRSIRFSLPDLAHSSVQPHTPPRRLPSPRRRSTRQISPSPSRGANVHHGRTSKSERRLSPSPGRSASPSKERRRSSTNTRRRLSRSRSPSNSRSISPSSLGERGRGSASGNSSHGSQKSIHSRTSRTQTNSRSISPSNSWDRGSASGASGSSSYGSMHSGSRRRRSRASYPSSPVRERTLSPGSLRRNKQSRRLSHHLNDNNKNTDDHEKVPFRRLSPRSSPSIRRKSDSNVNSTPGVRQHRRKSDPVETRALRVRSKSPVSRWNSTACKSPPSICRRRPEYSKSPSSSRRRLPNAIASSRQIILQLTKEDWDGEDSVVWKKPSKASIMDDESSWTRRRIIDRIFNE